jgi:mono/diheme cytochrome c family protein
MLKRAPCRILLGLDAGPEVAIIVPKLSHLPLLAHRMDSRILVIAAIALAACPAVAWAQASPPQRSVWDSAYTAEQATSGEAAFRLSCSNCHAAAQFSGPAFLGAWEGGSAYELFQLVSEQMPFDNPGSLPKETYLAVLAYVFKLNGFPAGTRPLPGDAAELKQIRIHAKAEAK